VATPKTGGPVKVVPPSSLLDSYAIIMGAAWRSLALTSTDLPCGFTDLSAATRYFKSGTLGFGFSGIDAMPWVSKNDAVLAIGLAGVPKMPSTSVYDVEFVLYCNIDAISKAASSYTSLGQPHSGVQPIVPISACKANGLTYVAMCPWAPSPAPSSPVLTNCRMIVGWTNPPGGKLTPL
jgi:hypothetical protein